LCTRVVTEGHLTSHDKRICGPTAIASNGHGEPVVRSKSDWRGRQRTARTSRRLSLVILRIALCAFTVLSQWPEFAVHGNDAARGLVVWRLSASRSGRHCRRQVSGQLRSSNKCIRRISRSLHGEVVSGGVPARFSTCFGATAGVSRRRLWRVAQAVAF